MTDAHKDSQSVQMPIQLKILFIGQTENKKDFRGFKQEIPGLKKNSSDE